jgi:proteasome lid subunit RPN8/RPN11
VDAETHQVVSLPRAVVDEMLAHVQAGYPNEACGVLAGSNGQIVKNYPAINAAEHPDDFSIIGPEEMLRISDEIDDQDWSFFAYYHSHPQSQAYPSSRDIDYARYWPGTYYIIFSLRDRAHPELRIFSVNQDRSVIEHEVRIEP